MDSTSFIFQIVNSALPIR